MSAENQKPDDSELEQFMAGDSRLSGAYRHLQQETAPAELDQAVLRMARQAVAAPRPARWRLPLALAASVLLSLSTVWMMRQDRVARSEAFLDESGVTLPPALMRDAPAVRQQAPMQNLQPQAAPAVSREKPAKQKRAAAAKPAAPAAPRPESGVEAGTASGWAEQKMELRSFAAQPDRDALAKEAGGAAATAPAQPPAEWLQHIRALRDRNDLEAARNQLRRFAEAHPDHAIPDDLKPLLN